MALLDPDEFEMREAGVPPPPISVTDRFRALGLIGPDPEDQPVETIPDHETGAFAAVWVLTQGRRVREKLTGLRNWYRAHPEDFE